MRGSNLGVQLYPIILLAAAFGFYMLQAYGLFWFCFLLSVVFWCALFSDSVSK